MSCARGRRRRSLALGVMATLSAASVAPAATPAATPRIVGVDTARGLAIIGMFIAHLGLERSTDFFSTTGWFWVTDGRSSALFATLAGTGLAFMTKRAYATGDPVEYATQRTRLLKRSAILMVLGWFLTALGTPVAVILGAYALLFVLAIPFLRLRPTALLACAGGIALVVPSLVLLSRYALLGGRRPSATPRRAASRSSSRSSPTCGPATTPRCRG